MANIKSELQIFNTLKDRLAEFYALDRDDEAVVDTADGETNLSDAIARMIRESRVAKAQADGVAKLAADMRERADRLAAKHDKLRALAAWAMTEAGFQKLARDDFSVSIRPGPAKVITTREAEIYDICGNLDYVTEKSTYKWKNDAIKEALERGQTLDFAYLSNGDPVMTVRTK